MAGAPRGNQNARKVKAWENALRWVLKNFKSGDVPQGEALLKIAEVCVIQALAGDKDARAEIACRLDGKPTEHIQASIEHKTLHELTMAELDERIARLATREEATASGADEPSELH